MINNYLYMKITAISTTTHKFEDSASAVAIRSILRECKRRGHQVKIINASKLHIVNNLDRHSLVFDNQYLNEIFYNYIYACNFQYRL